MISITKEEDCCGCGACVQRCPQNCISLLEDKEGFLYPFVNKDNCINCGLCDNVCPVINQKEPHKPIALYAAQNDNNEIRQKSSSGGIFTLLAEKVISDGGVVFGACFNNEWEVVHESAEDLIGINKFRGSKYVQSRIGNNYEKVELYLKQGREVLFTGTPCQIAGLHCFLRKEYERLITVDFICHGVPSPKVWRAYLDCKKEQILKKNPCQTNYGINNIEFRNKTLGWSHFSFCIDHTVGNKRIRTMESLHKNLFLKGFLSNLYLRPSCHKCPAKYFKSNSDITIGDYWGIEKIHPSFYDDKGSSLLIQNTTLGKEICQKLTINKIETDYYRALRYNPSMEHSVSIPAKRSIFFYQFQQGNDLLRLIEKLSRVSIQTQLKQKVKKVVKMILFSNK